METLTPQDATRYWLSRRTCNDLFLLYCFDDAGGSSADLRAAVAERSAGIADLSVRVRERRFAYPVWEPRGFTDDQVIEHDLTEPTWPNVVAALGDLLPHGLRADQQAWRLHVFRGVRGAPGGDAPALLTVLQISHALADGQRAAAIARALFTERPRTGDQRTDDKTRPRIAPEAAVPRARPPSFRRTISPRSFRRVIPRQSFRRAFGRNLRHLTAQPPVAELVSLLTFPVRLGRTVIRGFAAERARRELAERTERGEVPPPAPSFPPTLLNRPPAPKSHAVRLLVRDDLRIPGSTVTVVVLTAVASALTRYLAARGEPAADLAAQVSMALPERNGRPRNNYRDLGIELHGAERDLRRRAQRIAADLELRRARAGHPLLRAQDRVTAVLPAPVLRRDVATYPMDQVPDALGGHTVVSSVNRGPADLTFGGGGVRCTAGFPALGAVMHLTHGVHGLGGTVTVSVHADPAVIPDIDTYADLLDNALTEVLDAVKPGAE
ncbi:WS/DGAT domain-containing protein [Nocardia thraciensis]